MADDVEFVAAGREYLKTHPGFNERLQDAAARGLDLPPAAIEEIKRLGALGCKVADRLADPQNEMEACGVMSLKGERAVDKIRRIAAQEKARGEDFQVIEQSPTDAYLTQRRMDLRTGKRRR